MGAGGVHTCVPTPRNLPLFLATSLAVNCVLFLATRLVANCVFFCCHSSFNHHIKKHIRRNRCNWVRLHPSVTSAILLMLSFWIGYSCNLLLLLLTEWIFARVYCAPVCAFCWCAPAGWCSCNRPRPPTDPPRCSSKCCGSCLGVLFVCSVLINPLSVWVMAIGCQTSCELTGWQPGTNEMEEPLETLFAAEYFGLYRDFLDQDFTQPCVLAGALDQLIGPDGAVRDALEENHRHWNNEISVLDDQVALSRARARSLARSFSLPPSPPPPPPHTHTLTHTVSLSLCLSLSPGQIAKTKGWIARHGSTLRSAVATRCATMPGECIRGALSFSLSRSLSRARATRSLSCSACACVCVRVCVHIGASCLAGFPCATGERCEQGSLQPSCVSNTDACGCTSGGWSTPNRCCSETASTSEREVLTHTHTHTHTHTRTHTHTHTHCVSICVSFCLSHCVPLCLSQAAACAAGSLVVQLGAVCDETHYDWCGCSPGTSAGEYTYAYFSGL